MSKGGFCTLCGVHYDSFDGMIKCTNCGSTGVPCADDAQVTITINWHELSILCIWAENWAGVNKEKNPEMLGVLYAIADRIQTQAPERYALTFSGQMRECKDAGMDIESNQQWLNDTLGKD